MGSGLRRILWGADGRTETLAARRERLQVRELEEGSANGGRLGQPSQRA